MLAELTEDPDGRQHYKAVVPTDPSNIAKIMEMCPGCKVFTRPCGGMEACGKAKINKILTAKEIETFKKSPHALRGDI